MGHELVVGRTRSGKTTYARARALKHDGPVLFINTQEEDLTGYIRCDKKAALTVLRSALDAGFKLNYIPSADDSQALLELRVLESLIFDVGRRLKSEKYLLLVVDETQVYAGNNMPDSPLYRVARRGIAHGVRGTYITQRPADINNLLITQCSRHVIFKTSWESQYFRRYGLPGEEIEKKLNEAPDYSYLILEDGEIKGPYKD